jgi:membrane protease YdiL (CAAX protease family)
MEGLNNPAYIFLFVAVKLIVAYLFSRLASEYLGESVMSGFLEFRTETEHFIITVLFAPALETYFFQHLFFEYLSRYFKSSVIVFVSAFVFSLFHFYNSWYIVYAFFSGLLLSASYCYRPNAYPFLITLLIHSIYNLCAFLLNR